jgi:hypothetical protein
MAKQLAILALLISLFSIIVYLFLTYRYDPEDGVFEQANKQINQYTVYQQEIDKKDESNYTILFETEELFITTTDQDPQAYYLLVDHSFYSFTEAYQMGVIDLEDIEEFTFSETIVKRYKYWQTDDVIQVSYTSNLDTSNGLEQVINNGNNMEEFVILFDDFLFKERIEQNFQPLFHIYFELENEIMDIAVLEEGVLHVSTNTIAYYQETPNHLDAITIQSYFSD